AAAHDVALAADEIADLEAADVRAALHDRADELVPDNQRHRNRSLRPRVPVVDVQVGAADPGLVHPDQDVVDPDLRNGDVLERESRHSLRLDERAHAITLVREDPLDERPALDGALLRSRVHLFPGWIVPGLRAGVRRISL